MFKGQMVIECAMASVSVQFDAVGGFRLRLISALV